VNADLRAAKSASPDPAPIGRPLTYTVAVANDGPFAATRVRLTDALPAGVRFVPAASTAGTCAEADGAVRCNLGTLASGAGATVTIVVRPIRLGTITNTAMVTAPQTDPNPGNNTATVATNVVPH
jgi:large repetitive protein